MKYKVGDKVRIKDIDIVGTVESIIRGQLIVNYKDSKMVVWPEDVVLIESVEEETNACQKCVFAVYDDKPHCGLRGFRSDFNVERCSAENDTIPNGYELQEDGYFSWVEKKKEYPKTYKACCKVLDIDAYDLVLSIDYRSNKMKHNDWKRLGKLNALNQILICRDAYWKIAGEEMGLDKPWEPDYSGTFEEGCPIKYVIYSVGTHILKGRKSCPNHILAFPTEEMRDAFYEAFKEDIEKCKELL